MNTDTFAAPANMFTYRPIFAIDSHVMYNVVLEKLVLPVADALLQTSFISELKFWRNVVDKKSAYELKQLQHDRLNYLLQQSIATIPFYQKKNIQLTGHPYKDILQFPVMKKNNIRENIDSLYTGDKRKMVVEKSSGSSGIQGEVYMTMKENIGYQAVQTYLWEWGGYKVGMPLLQTGITPERTGFKKIKDILLRTTYVGSFDLSEEQAVQNLLRAKRNGCKYFGGYASSLNVHAAAALKAGIDVTFDGVISWGDKLFDGYKSTINRAFGNPSLAEVYGTTEGFMIAGLCSHGRHHILTPHVYLELLDKDGNEVKPGELGYVVVTRLDAFSFPLIRYYLGDMAVKEAETLQCSCGKHFPLLQKIVGRDTDIVHTPQGKALIVHFFTGIFEHEPGIQQFRVIQKIKGEIEIEYIPSAAFHKDTQFHIETKIHDRANEIFPVHFTQVKQIAATASGKPQLVLNTIVKSSINI